MTAFRLEFEVTLELEGTPAEVEELRDRIDDLIYAAAPSYCGEPECCPVKPEGIYITAGYSSSTINPITEEVEHEQGSG